MVSEHPHAGSGGDRPSILVVCAHPDDECIGAGGTVAKHAHLGFPVHVLCLTGNPERHRELSASCKTLGVSTLRAIERGDHDIDWSLRAVVVEAILDVRPAVVITHTPDDYNRAHEMCHRVVVEAVEWASHVTQFPNAHRTRQVLTMEINTLHPHPNILVDVSSSYDVAISALSEHKSQLRKSDRFYERFYDARTRLRGVQAGCERAEAFGIVLPTHAGPFYTINSVDTLL
ncbi:MAG: PIG-L deacetylase family protein [Candidatus Thorarchaeota archaeon]